MFTGSDLKSLVNLHEQGYFRSCNGESMLSALWGIGARGGQNQRGCGRSETSTQHVKPFH